MNNTEVKVKFNGELKDVIKLYGEDEAIKEFGSKDEWLKDSFCAIEDILGLEDFSSVISDISFIDKNTGKEFKKSDYYEVD